MKSSWDNLKGAYLSKALESKLQDLERSYRTTDETEFFACLVNMSRSKVQPYHRWIRYREGYAGDLVKELLRRYPVDHNAWVLDPMCGSGSTLVACKEEGFNSIGLDVNPYAILSSKVKCYSLSSAELDKCKVILESIRDSLTLEVSKYYSIHDEAMLKYFEPTNLDQLVAIKRKVELIADDKIKDLFYLALLAVVEDCSNRKKDGNGLATRKTKISCCFSHFEAKLSILVEDFSRFPHLDKVSSITHCESALKLTVPLEDYSGKVGSIIFSPPYANSFDYFESYKMELIFGEWMTPESLKEERKKLVRNYRLGHKKELVSELEIVELLCEELWNRIPIKEEETGKRDGRTRLVPNMLRTYFDDMKLVLEEGFEVLAPGGTVHIVVDQSAYLGAAIPTDLILAQVSEFIGFEVLEVVKCRRAMTSAQQLKKYPYLKDILRESIVTIRKPV
ncbi:DNA methyltransferase [Vibrio vulnificus]|uniref:DNA methyltransferase n=1 Tax=Vibrio vulnificus TaxID=672 RepID=UPI00405A4582